MIVMKFGGSSVESGEAIQRLIAIVKGHLDRKPVVVVSAMGKTTDRLLKLAEEAECGHVYFVSTHIAELKDYHFDEAAKVVNGEALEILETSLRRHFRDLHTTLAEISDEGRDLTPELRDEIVSYGERMSSEIVAAALSAGGVPSIHLDARQVIVTDDQYGHATPLYFESYGKLRRAIVMLARERVVVMGGFIAATENGATSTLGRGGSDLTASIVGAGIAADEIQIWTDVDGMLTCDPCVLPGGFRLKSISYKEAGAMARCGAKVLHPDTVLPAVRQLIPVVIKNSRRPEVEGTRIGPTDPGTTRQVKSISCRQDRTVLEIRWQTGEAGQWAQSLIQLCRRNGLPAELIGEHSDAVFLAIGNDLRYEQLRLESRGCVQVHLRPQRAILSLVGDGIAEITGIATRALDVSCLSGCLSKPQ
jgi:aspartate kinase